MGPVGTLSPCTCAARPHALPSWNARRLGQGRLATFAERLSRSRPGSSGRSLRLEVCAVKGAGKKRVQQQSAAMGGQMAPPTPPVDPDNVEFVLFIRAVKFPQWYPLSVVKGGSAANLLTRAMEYEFGRLLYGKTLVRNIGQVVYNDRRKVEAMVRRSLPMMKNFKEFEYGFKIRDKARPNDWYFAENITLIPPPEQLKGTVVDQVTSWFERTFRGGGSGSVGGSSSSSGESL